MKSTPYFAFSFFLKCVLVLINNNSRISNEITVNYSKLFSLSFIINNKYKVYKIAFSFWFIKTTVGVIRNWVNDKGNATKKQAIQVSTFHCDKSSSYVWRKCFQWQVKSTGQCQHCKKGEGGGCYCILSCWKWIQLHL